MLARMELFSFILSYFVNKNLAMMTAYICWRPDQVSELWRMAMRTGVRLTVQNNFNHTLDITPFGMFREAILLDIDCPDSEFVLEKASSSRGFNHRFSWVLINNSSYDRSIIEDVLEPFVILPDADVVWASPDAIVDVYRVKPDQPYMLSSLGLNRSCSERDLIAVLQAWPSAVIRRKDLRNVSLKAATVLSQPMFFKGWNDLRNKQIDTYPKLTYPLMWLAAEDMNIHMNLRQVDVYGVMQNGSWDGLAGLLQREEVELGVASVFMRADRMRVLHYFSETIVLTCAFIFRQPSRSTVSNVFLVPFSVGVWVATGLLVVVVVIALVALNRLRSAVNPHPELAQLTFLDSCTFALGTLCQQGFHITPAVTSVRVVMFSSVLTSLFVFTAYSAKIVAILQSPSDAIRTLDDLTRSPMTLGVQETTYKKVYFTESADRATQHLYRRKLLPQGERAYHSVVDGITRVRTGFFAFMVERSSGYDIITKTFTEREKCSLKEIEAFKLPMVSIPMRKYSGYKELFASRLRWQREVGLMDRAGRVWRARRPRCEAGGGGFVTIGIRDVLPAMEVLAIGMALAALLLVGEICARAGILKNQRRHQRRQSRLASDVGKSGRSLVSVTSY